MCFFKSFSFSVQKPSAITPPSLTIHRFVKRYYLLGCLIFMYLVSQSRYWTPLTVLNFPHFSSINGNHSEVIHTSFTYIFIWVRKLDCNSFTKTKNWSGRNEVTETSGRLHPLWPQDKRLHTPRTTVYRHIRQDRCIQTELVSTLAKNATKPNPFEIVLLQTTRKENNWKTEETLERAVVASQTERIKGSNPWYLWWWWWSVH